METPALSHNLVWTEYKPRQWWLYRIFLYCVDISFIIEEIYWERHFINQLPLHPEMTLPACQNQLDSICHSSSSGLIQFRP